MLVNDLFEDKFNLSEMAEELSDIVTAREMIGQAIQDSKQFKHRYFEFLKYIREMLYCNFCKSEQRNMVKLMNIFSLHCKKLISKYYYGHKSCSKCQDSTRVFLKEK